MLSALESNNSSLRSRFRHAYCYCRLLAPGRALGDPADPARLRAEYDSGARVYPDGLGIQAVADAVDLAALARAAPARCPTGIPVSGPARGSARREPAEVP
jgi:hypothetical protein